MKLEELKYPKTKKIHRYYPQTKKETCQSGHHQMVLLSGKEVDSRKLHWQGTGLCQKNAYYEELKANSDVDKEYIDEHESDSKILQYDSEEASIKSEESDSE